LADIFQELSKTPPHSPNLQGFGCRAPLEGVGLPWATCSTCIPVHRGRCPQRVILWWSWLHHWIGFSKSFPKHPPTLQTSKGLGLGQHLKVWGSPWATYSTCKPCSQGSLSTFCDSLVDLVTSLDAIFQELSKTSSHSPKLQGVGFGAALEGVGATCITCNPVHRVRCPQFVIRWWIWLHHSMVYSKSFPKHPPTHQTSKGLGLGQHLKVWGPPWATCSTYNLVYRVRCPRHVILWWRLLYNWTGFSKTFLKHPPTPQTSKWLGVGHPLKVWGPSRATCRTCNPVNRVRCPLYVILR
jgi:hypothetical protein